MKKKSEQLKAVFLILVLAAAMMVVGCTPESPPLDPPTVTPESPSPEPSTVTPAADEGKKPDVTPTGKVDDRRDTFVEAKGAASEYELYTTTVAFLNNGFHYAELKDVFDITLSSVFYTKWQMHYGYNFTEGMSCKDAYNLFADLKRIASQMEAPTDDAEAAQLDFDAFMVVFPEDRQQQINEYQNAFKTMIVGYFFRLEAEYQEQEGINPFHSSQTTWEAVPEKEYSAVALDPKVLSEDVINSFPAIYDHAFEEYTEGNARYNGGYYYTEIDGRYYLLGFYSAADANAAR